MRVLHVIPSAFNYYDDIKAAAFDLIEAQTAFGVDSEAYTMQYQAPSRTEQNELPAKTQGAPGRKYHGTVSLAELTESISGFDAVHVHTPILGGLGTVIKWKAATPKLALIVTVYRQSRTPDFFSILLLVYNWFMLRRLFAAADFIAAESSNMLKVFYERLIGDSAGKVVQVDSSDNFLGEEMIKQNPEIAKMSGLERLAFKYVILYNTKRV